MTMKTDEEVGQEIAITFASAVLAGSIATRDNLVKSLTVISSVSIPSYVALLRVFGDSISSCTSLLLIYLPIGLFSLALIFCFVILFPKNFTVDYKNPIGVIQNHSKMLASVRKYAIGACICEILGVAVASLIFVEKI